ncbi:MAG TPA: DUF642 domain-containing protein, partial [Gemmataceae bacterium]|nr:DUF642 domain-containing protein [Gemmataceae bacterium]
VGSGTSAYVYNPTGSAWSFIGTAGLLGNGSAFGNPIAPQGTQAAFLQASSAITQAIDMAGGTYLLSFSAAQRPTNATSQAFRVTVDGAAVGTITPGNAVYAGYHTGTFTVTPGVHLIVFAAINPNGGDNTAFLDNVIVIAAGQPSDPGFESPSVGSGSSAYVYRPASSAWAFVGNAGLAGNGSAFTGGNPPAPEGTQVAFLQGSSSSISQSVTLAANTIYTISFRAAQRAGGNTSTQTFLVQVDGTTYATVTPFTTTYIGYITASFTVTAGAHTITFLGMNPNGGDNTAFIDQVAINPA